MDRQNEARVCDSDLEPKPPFKCQVITDAKSFSLAVKKCCLRNLTTYFQLQDATKDFSFLTDGGRIIHSVKAEN